VGICGILVGSVPDVLSPQQGLQSRIVLSELPLPGLRFLAARHPNLLSRDSYVQ
jgi:hypothetical protein